MVIAQNITEFNDDRPILIPVYTDRYNYKLPNNHRLDASLDYKFGGKNLLFKLSVGAYNVYNQSNPSFVYFSSKKRGQPDQDYPEIQGHAPLYPVCFTSNKLVIK